MTSVPLVADQPTPASGSKEILVFMVRRQTQCSECGAELWGGSLLRLEGGKALCIACADLDHLEFLGSGDAAITRRATKYSTLRAVVLRWARARKRYERQGILAEPAAIDRAEEECLADADLRRRRQERAAEKRQTEDRDLAAQFTGAIRAQFPGCPPAEAAAIAERACQRYSGRIGRTAAGKALDPEAVRLAVIAHIRHAHTDYDRLLARYTDRALARYEVGDTLAEVLDRWERSAEPPASQHSALSTQYS